MMFYITLNDMYNDNECVVHSMSVHLIFAYRRANFHNQKNLIAENGLRSLKIHGTASCMNIFLK